MTEVEPVVEPDSVGNDVGWKSMALVCVHTKILAISASLLVSTLTQPRCQAS